MLCIAGAYLLRAAVQSAALPRWPAIIAAIAWAFVWLVPATRVAAKAWFNSAVWAATSAIILVPMLWELTLRFHFLPATASAAILGAFVIAAAALAWNRHFAAVSWTAYAAASLAALVLGIATRDLVPFLVVLLVMAMVSETAADFHRAPGVRFLPAIAADCRPLRPHLDLLRPPRLSCRVSAPAHSGSARLRSGRASRLRGQRRHPHSDPAPGHRLFPYRSEPPRRIAHRVEHHCLLAGTRHRRPRCPLSDRLGRRIRARLCMVSTHPCPAQLSRLRHRKPRAPSGRHPSQPARAMGAVMRRSPRRCHGPSRQALRAARAAVSRPRASGNRRLVLGTVRVNRLLDGGRPASHSRLDRLSRRRLCHPLLMLACHAQVWARGGNRCCTCSSPPSQWLP